MTFTGVSSIALLGLIFIFLFLGLMEFGWFLFSRLMVLDFDSEILKISVLIWFYIIRRLYVFVSQAEGFDFCLTPKMSETDTWRRACVSTNCDKYPASLHRFVRLRFLLHILGSRTHRKADSGRISGKYITWSMLLLISIRRAYRRSSSDADRINWIRFS